MRFSRLGITGVTIAVVAPFAALAQTSCPQITQKLSFGSRGADVVQLQHYLISQNLLAADSATGYFGKLTESVVQQWQSSHGIVSSGSAATTGYGAVGPKTRAAIAAACSGTSTTNPSSTPSTGSGQANQSLINSLLAQVKVLQEKLAQLLAARGGGGGGGGGGGNPTPSAPPAPTQPVSCTFNGQTIAHGSSVTAYQSSSVAYGSQCVSETRTCNNGTLSGSYSYVSCVVGTASSCTWNGQTVANGTSVTAYQTSSVPFGSQCTSETRICTTGTLSGSYQNATCIVSERTPHPYPSAFQILIDTNQLNTDEAAQASRFAAHGVVDTSKQSVRD